MSPLWAALVFAGLARATFFGDVRGAGFPYGNGHLAAQPAAHDRLLRRKAGNRSGEGKMSCWGDEEFRQEYDVEEKGRKEIGFRVEEEGADYL